MDASPHLPLLSSGVHSNPRTSTSVPHLAKETGTNFVFKQGRKHHRYQPDKVPYPLDYSCDSLDVISLERVWESYLGHNITWVDFGDNPPKKILDLGCGSGLWASLAAQEWPDCEVVGFDLVDVQIPLRFLEHGHRMKWVYGNFLSTRLPFDDETFDYVHMSFIANGVPENKWDTLYAEVQRVAKPGGVVELVDEDIIFPVLPRWFTSALHPTAPDRIAPPEHDYALLERLFYSVFERRFINLKPTSATSGYFSAYFSNVSAPTARMFPMPPYRLPPRPTLSELQSPVLRRSLPFSSSASFPLSSPSTPDSTYLTITETSFPESYFDLATEDFLIPGNGRRRLSSNYTSFSATDPGPASTADFWGPPLTGISKESGLFSEYTQTHWKRVYSSNLVRIDKELSFVTRTLPVHLWMALQTVSACKEAMWEELENLLITHPEQLERLGWLLIRNSSAPKDHAYVVEEGMESSIRRKNRSQFEELFDRYCYDMNLRISTVSSLEDLGWSRPASDPRSQAELLQIERLHEAYEEAREKGLDSIDDTVCRVIRLIVGYRGDVEVAY